MIKLCLKAWSDHDETDRSDQDVCGTGTDNKVHEWLLRGTVPGHSLWSFL